METCEQVDFAVQQILNRLNIKERRGIKDYISCPQDSGYRSHHIIAVVPGETLSSRVEIQVRTRLQHSWATGVEAASAIYGQDYKSPENLVDLDRPYENVKQFFQLASALFALEEGRPVASNMPTDKQILKHELKSLPCYEQVCSDLLDATDSSFQSITHILSELGSNLYLLEYDREEQVLYSTPFSTSRVSDALDWYNQSEEEDVFSMLRDTVLVYATSSEYLSAAFPNYSTNLNEFTENLRRCME